MMEFEWDEEKRWVNLKKHGIDFVDVPKMFERPMLVALDDRRGCHSDHIGKEGHTT